MLMTKGSWRNSASGVGEDVASWICDKTSYLQDVSLFVYDRSLGRTYSTGATSSMEVSFDWNSGVLATGMTDDKKCLFKIMQLLLCVRSSIYVKSPANDSQRVFTRAEGMGG